MAQIDFNELIATLSDPAALAEYVDTRSIIRPELFLDRLLPTQQATTDEIISGTVRHVATAAQVTALDAPFHQGGGVVTAEVSGVLSKLTIQARLTESDRRAMIAASARLGDTAVVNAVRGLLDVNLSLSMDLGYEAMRAAALAFDGKKIGGAKGRAGYTIESGLPETHKLNRKGANNWSAAGSTFWADVITIGDLLDTPADVRLVMNPADFAALRGNSANKIRVVSTQKLEGSQNVTVYSVTKISETVNGNDVGADEVASIYVYSLRTENADGTPGSYILPTGRTFAFRPTTRSLTLADGSVVQGNLGVLFEGPNGHNPASAPGRNVRLYVPQENTAELRGQMSAFVRPQVQESRNLVQIELA